MQVNNTKIRSGVRVLIVLFLTAVGVVAPIVYHTFGLTGTKFLPIFLVLSISAYKCSSIQLYALAVLIPLVNHLITGMPAYSPLPVLQYIIFEGLIFSTIITLFRSSKIHFSFILIAGIILGRCSSIVFVLLYPNFTLNVWTNIISQGLPGILLNFVVACVPLVLEYKNRT